jgi:predicted PurR-regulated permease PerM
MFGFDLRIARIIWTVVLVALLLYIIYSVRATLVLIIFAIFFAYLVYPLVQFVERNKPPRMPRTAAIALVFILVVSIVALAVTLFGAQMGEQAVNFGQQLPKLLTPENLSQHIPLPGFLEPIRARMLNFLSEQLQTGTGQALPLVQRLGVGIMHAISNLFYVVLVPILSFLLIKDAPWMQAQILSWLDDTHRKLWTVIAKDLHLLLAGFVRALLLLSLATFVSYSIVFSALGVPYALVLAGIAALLEFIPVVGPLVSAGVVLGVSAFSGYAHLLWLAAFFIAYRIFQDYVLSPYLMSAEVELSPFFVIVGLLAGEQLAGVTGMFLSIPTLAALKLVVVRGRAFARRARIN